MSVIRMFADTFNTKLSDCKDIAKYTSWYQIAFDKIVSLLNEDLWIFKRLLRWSYKVADFSILEKTIRR